MVAVLTRRGRSHDCQVPSSERNIEDTEECKQNYPAYLANSFSLCMERRLTKGGQTEAKKGVHNRKLKGGETKKKGT